MESSSRTVSDVLPAVLAGIRQGAHLCAFYETMDDLFDLVLPFFAGGASRDEACVWVLSDSMSIEEATLRARAALGESGIELYPAREHFLLGSHFTPVRALAFWNEKLQRTLAVGRPGLRGCGCHSWLRVRDWKAWLDYEDDLTKTFADKPITVLCAFPLSLSKVGDIFEIACKHHLTIAKHQGKWEAIKGWRIGEPPLTPRQRRANALDAADRILSLSRRERQVLDGLAAGRSSKEIAAELGISVRTVEVYRARALDRLEVRTSAEAVRLATLANLIVDA